ncbi:MAG: M23 family metallopeptidase [Spirochaetaceae bacterium]|jgi:murein DD-endopeptidase MepM/ murein hydrolase activator NlpD|nr:M23 family metallopeptidase [Spirochaetaceae bacterium]
MGVLHYSQQNIAGISARNAAGISVNYGASTTEMLLNSQQPLRRPGKGAAQGAVREFKKGLNETAKNLSELVQTGTALFVKCRMLLLALAAGTFLLTGWQAAVYLIHLHVRPVSFQITDSLDRNSAAHSLQQFVLPTPEPQEEAQAAHPLPAYTEPVSYQTYTVKSGDSISSIARRSGLTNISTLISVNTIENAKRIRPGQSMLIPSRDGIMHTVNRSDTLLGIADKYSITMDMLVDSNDLSSAVIHTGDRLFIPNATLASLDLKKAMGELFIDPLVSWRLTSPYGERKDPFTGVRSFHTGLDMAAPPGTPIKASLDGKVSVAGFSNVYGNYVIITHGNGYQTLYAHMTSYSVRKGQTVLQGAAIGKVGSTGYSTGPHLHFTVYQNGRTVNPFEFLN